MAQAARAQPHPFPGLGTPPHPCQRTPKTSALGCFLSRDEFPSRVSQKDGKLAIAIHPSEKQLHQELSHVTGLHSHPLSSGFSGQHGAALGKPLAAQVRQDAITQVAISSEGSRGWVRVASTLGSLYPGEGPGPATPEQGGPFPRLKRRHKRPAMHSVQAASLFSWRAWMNVMQVFTPLYSSCHPGLCGEHRGYCAEGHTCQKAGNQRAWGNVGGFAAREI